MNIRITQLYQAKCVIKHSVISPNVANFSTLDNNA